MTSPGFFHPKKWAILAIALACIGVCVAVLTFMRTFTDPPKQTGPIQTDIPNLLKKVFPGLQPAQIDSCQYAFESQTKSDLVPAPSDTRIQVKGSIRFTAQAAQELQSKYSWTPVSHAQLPPALASDLSSHKNLFTSAQFNQSFEKNATYTWGYVATPESEKCQVLYFVVQDLDHPLFDDPH
jgi:hypothetical protein